MVVRSLLATEIHCLYRFAMLFEQYMDEVTDPGFQVGDIVLGKVFRVDPEDGLYVRFEDPVMGSCRLMNSQ